MEAGRSGEGVFGDLACLDLDLLGEGEEGDRERRGAGGVEGPRSPVGR